MHQRVRDDTETTLRGTAF